MRKPLHTLLSAALLVLPLTANALRLQMTEVTCPLDGSTFKFSRMLSGTSFGSYLDMQSFGMTLSPAPLAKCPTNGFVMYKDKFSADEIARLKEYVDSPEYQAMRAVEQDYYIAAKLQYQLDEDAHRIAATLLQATWQAWAGEQYTRYATEALQAHGQLLNDPTLGAKRWLTYQLVAGELERRLGRFDEATARFTALLNHYSLTTDWHRNVVVLQLKLIAARNSGSHKAPEFAR